MNDEMIKRIGEHVRIDLLTSRASYTFENVARIAISSLTPADLAALVAEKCWQPIETMTPEDGRVLATLPVHHAQTKEFWYTEYHVIWLEAETGELHEDAYQGWDLEDYEYWMPLPAAPAPGGE